MKERGWRAYFTCSLGTLWVRGMNVWWTLWSRFCMASRRIFSWAFLCWWRLGLMGKNSIDPSLKYNFINSAQHFNRNVARVSWAPTRIYNYVGSKSSSISHSHKEPRRTVDSHIYWEEKSHNISDNLRPKSLRISSMSNDSNKSQRIFKIEMVKKENPHRISAHFQLSWGPRESMSTTINYRV